MALRVVTALCSTSGKCVPVGITTFAAVAAELAVAPPTCAPLGAAAAEFASGV